MIESDIVEITAQSIIDIVTTSKTTAERCERFLSLERGLLKTYGNKTGALLYLKACDKALEMT